MTMPNTGYVPSSLIKGEGGITVSQTGGALKVSGTGSGVGAFAFQVLGNPFSGPGSSLRGFEVNTDVVHGWVDEVAAFYVWLPNDATATDDWRVLSSTNSRSGPGRWHLVGDTLALHARGGGLDDGPMLTSASNALGSIAGSPAAELQGGTLELRSTNAIDSPEEFTLLTPWIMTGPSKLSVRGNPDVRFHSLIGPGLGGAIQVVPGGVGVLVSTTLAAPTTGDSPVITTVAPIPPGREIRIEEAGVLTQTYQVLSAVGTTLTLDRTVLHTFTAAATVKTLSRARVKIDGQGMTISGTGDFSFSTESTVDLVAANLNWDPVEGTPTVSSYQSRGDFFADVSSLRCAMAGAGATFGVNVISGEQVSVRHSTVEDIAPGVLNACYHMLLCNDCELIDSLGFMTPFAPGDVLQLETTRDVRVRGCTLEGGTLGADVKIGNKRTVIESTRTSENSGISVNSSSEPRIAQCSCVHNGATISLTGTEGAVVEGCVVEHDDQLGNGVTISGALGRTLISDLVVMRCSVGLSINGSDVDVSNVLLLDNSQAGINVQSSSPAQILRVTNMTERAGLGTAATWRGILLNGYAGKLYVDSSQITMNVAGQTAIRHVASGPITSGIVVLAGNHTWTESVAGTFGYFQDVGVTGTMRRTGRHDYAVTTPITKSATGFLNIDVVTAPGAGVLAVPWPDLKSTDHINLELQGGVVGTAVPAVAQTPGVGFDVQFAVADAGTTWQYQVNS